MAEDKKKEIDVTEIEVTEEYLKEKLYKVRGKRVLLDADLAEIYGYDTKGFNRQVKNNIEKFDEDFMFELTDQELEDLRYKNCTANISSKSRYNPHVFTEQGLYMLMTVLKGPLAVKQSKALIRTFKKMKDYILENRDLIGQREILQLSMETANNRIEINKNIFQERREDGNRIQNIKFQFPVPIIKEGEEVAQIKGISLDKEKPDEHMVSLEKLSALEMVVLPSRAV